MTPDPKLVAPRGLRRPITGILGLLLAVCACLFGPPTQADTIVIRAGRMIDTVGGRLLERQMIVVRDGTIDAVGTDLAVPPGAREIDLSAYTVLPGLMDAHTHLVGLAGDVDPLTELANTSAQRALQSLPNARTTLMAGFTTVRDLGSYRALVDVALRDAINRGDAVGPRMLVVGAYITITGGAGAVTGQAADVILPWDLRYGTANSADEVRERVRALAGQRVDAIKVLATGAVLTHNSNANAREATYEELAAAVEEGRNYGLKVAAHAHSPVGIRNAVRAGVASIEHGSLLDAEGRALMKQHGTYLVPTLEAEDCILSGAFPADFLQNVKKVNSKHLENFRAAVAAGVRIGFGTDISVCPYGENAREFTYLIANGMTPMQAIQSATIGDADLLGIADHAGSISAGKWADLVATRDDPLQDVRRLEHIVFVMKDGVVYKQDGVAVR